jgi:hypothetical protein
MNNTQALLEFMQRHPRLLVIGGAGCSTASGIPDYRDENGDWKRPQPMTFQRFTGDALARKRYWARSMVGWRNMSTAQPTLAHHALAALEQLGRVVLLVTQNVDGLHQAAGSRSVVDLHGCIDTVCCLQCECRLPRQEVQDGLVARNPGWWPLKAASLPDGDADLESARPSPASTFPPALSAAACSSPMWCFLAKASRKTAWLPSGLHWLRQTPCWWRGRP